MTFARTVLPIGYLSFNFRTYPNINVNVLNELNKFKFYQSHNVYHSEHCIHLSEEDKDIYDYCLIINTDKAYTDLVYEMGIKLSDVLDYCDNNIIHFYKEGNPEILLDIRLFDI